MKLHKLLLIISIVLISLGGAAIIAGSILSLTGNGKVGDILLGVSSILGLAALALMIYRLIVMSKRPEEFRTEQPRIIVKVVDVKEMPKSNEQKLYEQYEDLYKRNLISKEELDQKRIELLGK